MWRGSSGGKLEMISPKHRQRWRRRVLAGAKEEGDVWLFGGWEMKLAQGKASLVPRTRRDAHSWQEAAAPGWRREAAAPWGWVDERRGNRSQVARRRAKGRPEAHERRAERGGRRREPAAGGHVGRAGGPE